MVLVETVLNLAPPHRSSTNLGWVCVALHNQHIAVAQCEGSGVARCDTDELDLTQVERVSLDVGNTQIRQFLAEFTAFRIDGQPIRHIRIAPDCLGRGAAMK